MPVDPRHYELQGDGNHTVIIRCPHLVGDRLVHFTQNRLSQSWVIRDFITRLQLMSIASHLTPAAIEADADYSEPAPSHSVARVEDWAGYLLLKTMFVFNRRRPTSTTPPNAASGAWSSLSGAASGAGSP